MDDLTRMIIMGSAIDKVARENGYHGKSCVPWGKVGLYAGLSLFNSALKESRRTHSGYYRYHKKKKF